MLALLLISRLAVFALARISSLLIFIRPASRGRSRPCRRACSCVAGHAARGTTAPLSATAMPFCSVSTAFSASKAASVAAASGSVSPFTRIEASLIIIDASLVIIDASLVGVSKSFGRARRQKALEAERLDRRLDNIVEDQPRHRIGRHRRQQNAVAMMAGGIEQAVERATARGSARHRGCPADGRPKFRRSAIPRPRAPRARRLRARSACRRR